MAVGVGMGLCASPVSIGTLVGADESCDDAPADGIRFGKDVRLAGDLTYGEQTHCAATSAPPLMRSADSCCVLATHVFIADDRSLAQGKGIAAMRLLQVTVGSLEFIARLEDEAAPQTCAAFSRLLPFQNQLVQARWSGEAAWIPLGDLDLGIGHEHHTSHPAPGDLLLYPGGLSETEILFPYGSTLFASKVGQLAGNHFLTIVEGREQLPELGRRVLWDGAQNIRFTYDE